MLRRCVGRADASTRRLRASLPFVVMSMSIATFTDVYLYSTIVPVIPFAFQYRLGVPADRTQHWTTASLAAYSAGLIVGSLTSGFLADRMRRRKALMLAGLCVMLAATVLLCCARSTSLYIVGRVFQGISGGLVWTVGLAMITDVAPAAQLAFVLSFPTLSVSLGIVLGPVIGGVVYQRAGYYAVYYICFAIIAVDIVMRLLVIETIRPLVGCQDSSHVTINTTEHDDDIDKELTNEMTTTSSEQLAINDVSHIAGSQATLLVEETIPAATVTSTTSDIGDSSVVTTSLDDTKRSQKRSKWWKRLQLPFSFRLLLNLRFVNALLQTVVVAWIMTSIDATLSLHLKELFGFNSLQSGLTFLAIGGTALAGPLVGVICDRFGPRLPIALGLLIACPNFILLREPRSDTSGDVALFMVLLSLAGLGLAMVATPVTAELATVTGAVDKRYPGRMGPGRGVGQAYAFFNVAFSLGSLVGPLESGAVRTSRGWGAEMLALGIICAVTVVPTLLCTGGFVLNRRKKHEPNHDLNVVEDGRNNDEEDSRHGEIDHSDTNSSITNDEDIESQENNNSIPNVH